MNEFEKIISGRQTGFLFGLARAVLGGLSVLYGGGMRARNFLYDKNLLNSARLPCAVISVGNLTVGGTGKTPLVEYIARRLLSFGRRVVVLSRGYRARETSRGTLNDEAQVLEENIPGLIHIQSKDRVAAGLSAVREHGPHVIILDDGFQHRRLKRDLDILVIDAANPFGHGRLLPRGLLREAIFSAIRAQCIVISKSSEIPPEAVKELVAVLAAIAPKAKIFSAVYRPVALEALDGDGAAISPAEAKGRRVLAFCGIGAPRSFRASLEEIGCEIVRMVEFPDHHNYRAKDIDGIRSELAESRADFAVMTQKDAVEVRRFDLRNARFLKIEMVVAQEEEFGGLLDETEKSGGGPQYHDTD